MGRWLLSATTFCDTGECLETFCCHFRILVQSGIHDKFVDALKDSIESLKQGGPFEEGVNVGPLINGSAVDKVRVKELCCYQ